MALAPLLFACAREGTPDRLVAGAADTVIVNYTHEAKIPLRVLDERGHVLSDSGARYRWVGGDSLSISSDGRVKCLHSMDASVEVSLNHLRKGIVVRCRPIAKIRIAGPVQFILPDTAKELRMQILDTDDKEVSLLNGTSGMLDSTIASLDGIRVIPKAPGSTVASVRFGNRTASVGVHVYETASTLDVLRHGNKMVGVPLRMSGGETKTWSLPPGTWMITMLPESDETTGLQLRIDGANCTPLQLTRRRYGCLVKGDAWLTIFHPSPNPTAPTLSGELLVRHVNS